MRWLFFALACSALGTPALAAADAVDPCPPGFDPSHSGCHFDPEPEDFGVCGACGCALVGIGLGGAAIFLRRDRAKGRREG
ncbi:MAG: hypothetical protein U0234_20655 [Sandaracinus sp.]